MASILQNGKTFSIQLSEGECKGRPRIILGKITKRQANEFKTMLCRYIEAKGISASIPADIAEWINSLSGSVKERLITLGLIEASGGDYTVLDWAARYIEIKKSNPSIQKTTIFKYLATYRKLEIFFKTEKVSDVTPLLANQFRKYLKEVVRVGNKPLSENTINKHFCHIKEIFAYAVDQELIKKNPFDGQKTSVSANPERFFYVSLDLAKQVLDACPDTETKLMFALARFGGLRIPSELKDLRWSDIHFDKDIFTVRSPKTHHHNDKGVRQIPIFQELKGLFLQAFEEAPAGEVFVLPRYRRDNPRTMFSRMLDNAGIPVWTKIFQNCRSTRETELFKMTNGNVKAVCSWLGNTPAIAMKHYAQITDADMKQAAAMGLINQGLEAVSFEPENTLKKCVQKTVHFDVETSRNDLQVVSGKSDITLKNCSNLQQKKGYLQKDANTPIMGSTGLEPVTPCL